MGLLGARKAVHLYKPAAAAAPGGDFTPADISTLAWYDFTDLSTMWQESTKSTQVSANNDPIGAIDDKSGNARHLIQATSGDRPLYQSATPHALFDNSNDGLDGASVSFSGETACSVWIAIDVTDAYFVLAHATTFDKWIGLAKSDGGPPSTNGSGTVAFYTDGVLTTSTASTDLHAAWSGAGPIVIEARDVNLTNWAAFYLGEFGGNALGGKIYQVLVTTSAVSTANRDDIATYMAGLIA